MTFCVNEYIFRHNEERRNAREQRVASDYVTEDQSVNKNDNSRSRSKRAATAKIDRLWEYAVIPYEVEANFSGKIHFSCLYTSCFFNFN